MTIKNLTSSYSVSEQIRPGEIAALAAKGFTTLVNNRPDFESADQPTSDEVRQAADRAGMTYYYLPVRPNEMPESAVNGLRKALAESKGAVLAFCRTGNRSSKVFEALNQDQTAEHTEVLVVGGGAAGLATTASLLKRDKHLQITVIEPKDEHYYQPGWTLIGGGVFQPEQTKRSTASVMPPEATWIKDSVTQFIPEQNQVVLASGKVIQYQALVVAPGIKLDWDQIEGARETLGENGVSSNYEFAHAATTWRNVKALETGKAVFTQPPMPIKCAGAPQKAMYLSADYWAKQQRLKDIDIEFYNAGGVLFGVPDYVPALERYVEKYGISLNFGKTLTAVDGPAKQAWFTTPEGERFSTNFDMLHISPPQCAPDFVSASKLANEAGWVDVSQTTLQHTRYGNVFSLGDVCSAPNAKTAAAVRKQAPVVAHNLISLLQGRDSVAHYDGYGSCPLIVERGKVILAEFGYGGKILPTAPTWLINGKKPTWAGWFLKATMLPPIYFDLMLKGNEFLAAPRIEHKVLEPLSETGA
jgi:sulfide:quinone oxidoreductase